MLIKLTAIPHPDLDGGKPHPVYIDASRVLLITRWFQQHAKLGTFELKREAYDDLWSGIQRLTRLLHEKMPTEIDTQEAAKYAKDMHVLMHDLQDIHSAWGRAYRVEDYHPRVPCTEIQLACGTALEHGVMLTRVWVVESPEQVEEKVAKAISESEGRAIRRAV